jgi:transglutaminase superfamily protein
MTCSAFHFPLASDRRAVRRLKTGLVMARLLVAYIVLALLKHLVPLRWLVRWVWCPPVRSRDHEAERRLTAIVLRLSRLTGLPDGDCLQRSLLLYRVLSRAGADPRLVVGFQRIDGRIRGHAWVVVDGFALLESESDLVRFSPALFFGSQGVLLQSPQKIRHPEKSLLNCLPASTLSDSDVGRSGENTRPDRPPA